MMAELIQEERYPQAISVTFPWWQVAVTGLAVGALYFILTAAIGQFFIDPLFCRDSVNAAMCSNSVGVAGNVATVLIAAIGLGVLVSLRAARPIVVVTVSAILLWGLSTWTQGLGWAEIVAWSALLYGLSYVLFSWICRFNDNMSVVVGSLLVAVVARIVTTLW